MNKEIPKLARIPRGWELIPVGCRIRKTDKVCPHPHKKWRFAAHIAPDARALLDSAYCPYGYYIRRIKPSKKK
jgi:hypothetical protein